MSDHGSWKNLGLEPLELLDLNKRRTIGEVVEGMALCSFGARCLGEVAATLVGWVETDSLPSVVFDGEPFSPLDRVLHDMVTDGFAREIFSLDDCRRGYGQGNMLVVGQFSERHERALFTRPGRTVFINQSEQCSPRLVQDGCFHDVVFSDPNFIIPILRAVLRERLLHQPTKPLELMKILERMPKLGGQVARGARVFTQMMLNKNATVFFTMSGAMTVAQMSLVIIEMMKRGWIKLFSTTGAAMAHGLVQGTGLKHFKHCPDIGDARLADLGLNRVTDTLEPESNLDHVADALNTVFDALSGRTVGPSELYRLIGEYLLQTFPDVPSILGTATERGIPVLTPAFVDSEVGNDLFTKNLLLRREGRVPIIIDPALDSHVIVDLMLAAEFPVIFSVGGGVPRNNTQNVAPLMEIANDRCGLGWPRRMFKAGCRVSPDAPHFGHLSGCTYEENKSWRKMDPNGEFAEIRADATMVWPLLVACAIQAEDEQLSI